MVKKLLALFLVVLMSINSFAAVVSDNDGSAFITKAEFDSLKNNFQSQIDQYNTSIDSKIDGAIAAYLSGIRVNKETKVKIAVDNYANMRFYKDFKLYGRVYSLNTSKTKSVSTLGWQDLKLPQSSRGTRGGMWSFTGAYGLVNQVSVAQTIFGGTIGYTQPENTDWAGTDLRNACTVPHETFRLLQDSKKRYYVVDYQNRIYPNQYWTVNFKRKNRNGSLDERAMHLYWSQTDEDHTFNVTLNNDSSKVLSGTFTGAQLAGSTKSDYTLDLAFSAGDIYNGMYQFIGGNGNTSESISSTSHYGANGSVQITRNLEAVIPYNMNYTNNLIKYGSFPYSATKQFQGWKVDSDGNIDYSEVTAYNKANCSVRTAVLGHASLVDWGWSTTFKPIAASGNEATGVMYLPIPPSYYLKDYGNGQFITNNDTMLKYCDGLVLTEGLLQNGDIVIKLKIIGYDALTEAINNDEKTNIFISNKELYDSPNYLTGTINDGTSNIYTDRVLNNLQLDCGKQYTITIPEYKIQNTDIGDKLYLRFIPADQSRYTRIEANSLDIKVVSE